jgi:DNA-binding PadR family transcriptional regulator
MVSDADRVAACRAVDDVWVTFDEIAIHGDVPRHRLRGVLTSCVKRGLMESRTSDAHGKVEYAITPEGDKVAGRV